MSDAMLSLAKAVYGDAAHVGPQYEWHMDGNVTYRDAVVRVYTEDNGIEPFDPANNAYQFCDVLAWLLKGACVSMHGMPHCVGRGTIDVEGPLENDEIEFQHDGTAAGIRRAVVDAALRVVE